MTSNRLWNFLFPPRPARRYKEEAVHLENLYEQQTAWLYHDPGYYFLHELRVFPKPENLNYLVMMTVHKNHRHFPIPDLIKQRIPETRLMLECNNLNEFQRARIRQFYAELDQLLASVRDPDTPHIARIHMPKLYLAAETAANELYALR